MSSEAIGSIEFYSADLDRDITIKRYLKELLCTLWNEADGFSGKKPFGNSSWQHEVYHALATHNFINFEIEDGDFTTIDYKKADKIITEYIVEYL